MGRMAQAPSRVDIVRASGTKSLLTLEEAKQHLRVYDDSQDERIAKDTADAEDQISQLIGENVVPHEVKAYYPRFSDRHALNHRFVKCINRVQFQTMMGSTLNYSVMDVGKGNYALDKSTSPMQVIFNAQALNNNADLAAVDAPVMITYTNHYDAPNNNVETAVKVMLWQLYYGDKELNFVINACAAMLSAVKSGVA